MVLLQGQRVHLQHQSHVVGSGNYQHGLRIPPSLSFQCPNFSFALKCTKHNRLHVSKMTQVAVKDITTAAIWRRHEAEGQMWQR